MPAKSKAQQKAAGAALSAKRGETKPSKLIGASRQMYDSMSEEQLDESRKLTDGQRFRKLASAIVGVRLTWKELTGYEDAGVPVQRTKPRQGRGKRR